MSKILALCKAAGPIVLLGILFPTVIFFQVPVIAAFIAVAICFGIVIVITLAIWVDFVVFLFTGRFFDSIGRFTVSKFVSRVCRRETLDQFTDRYTNMFLDKIPNNQYIY